MLTALERRMLALSAIFGLLTLTLALGNTSRRLSGTRSSAASPATTGGARGPSPDHYAHWYGANTGWIGVAASEWPQRNGNWCGPAAIEVAANYTYQLRANNPNAIRFNGGGQQKIVNDLNYALVSASIWGTPSSNGIGPGFRADIARDGGADPRAMAWGIEAESAYGGYWLFLHNGGDPNRFKIAAPSLAFHDVIYHDNVTHAVGGLARTLEVYQQPIVVTVAHGLHFDAVGGVFSSNDPVSAFPANVDAVDVWDPAVGTPAGGYQSAREVLWDNYTFNSSVSMWGSTYSSNNGYDPDPSVGIYTPSSQYPHHWITYRTDFEPNHMINLLPDYALDENGLVMQHP